MSALIVLNPLTSELVVWQHMHVMWTNKERMWNGIEPKAWLPFRPHTQVSIGAEKAYLPKTTSPRPHPDPGAYQVGDGWRLVAGHPGKQVSHPGIMRNNPLWAPEMRRFNTKVGASRALTSQHVTCCHNSCETYLVWGVVFWFAHSRIIAVSRNFPLNVSLCTGYAVPRPGRLRVSIRIKLVWMVGKVRAKRGFWFPLAITGKVRGHSANTRSVQDM